MLFVGFCLSAKSKIRKLASHRAKAKADFFTISLHPKPQKSMDRPMSTIQNRMPKLIFCIYSLIFFTCLFFPLSTSYVLLLFKQGRNYDFFYNVSDWREAFEWSKKCLSLLVRCQWTVIRKCKSV